MSPKPQYKDHTAGQMQDENQRVAEVLKEKSAKILQIAGLIQESRENHAAVSNSVFNLFKLFTNQLVN